MCLTRATALLTAGFISQERVIAGEEGDAFIYMTPGEGEALTSVQSCDTLHERSPPVCRSNPLCCAHLSGVKMEAGGDSLGQQYNTPER